MSIDVFESAVRPQGRFGAVFERDEDSAYFYLFELDRPESYRIIGAFGLPEIVAMPADAVVRVAWTPEGDMAGLLAEGRLVAVFDQAGAQEGRWEGRRARNDERGRFLDG